MLPSGLAWRQDELKLDAAFPQNVDLLVVVIDGQTGDLADRAAQELGWSDVRQTRSVYLCPTPGRGRIL